MGDEQHRRREVLQRCLQRFAAFEVEVVRRLVEDEEVRARGDHHRERQPAPFTAGEHRNRLLVRLPAGEQEPPEQVLGLRTPEPRHRLDAVEHRAALVQLGLVLREVGGDDPVTEPGGARVRLQPAEQRLQQRGLARAVGPDQRNVLAALDRERDTVQQLLVSRREPQTLDLGNRASAARRVQELEPEPARAPREQGELVGDDRLLLLEPADMGQLGLRLLCLRLLVSEPVDEPLEPAMSAL